MHEHDERDRRINAETVYQQLIHFIFDEFRRLHVEEAYHGLVDGPTSLCDNNRPVDDINSMLFSSERYIDVLVDDSCDHSAYDYEPNVDTNARNQFDCALHMSNQLS